MHTIWKTPAVMPQQKQRADLSSRSGPLLYVGYAKSPGGCRVKPRDGKPSRTGKLVLSPLNTYLLAAESSAQVARST